MTAVVIQMLLSAAPAPANIRGPEKNYNARASLWSVFKRYFMCICMRSFHF
jgi:hypothetical protein